jgi:hypothetical protein
VQPIGGRLLAFGSGLEHAVEPALGQAGTSHHLPRAGRSHGLPASTRLQRVAQPAANESMY